VAAINLLLHHHAISGRRLDLADLMHHEPLIVALVAFALGIIVASWNDEEKGSK